MFVLESSDGSLCEKLEIVFLADRNDEASASTRYALISDCKYGKKAPDKHYFEHFFTYNKSRISTSDKAFVELIDGILASLKMHGTVGIGIESSASRVPTRSFSNNEELTKKRAEQAKDLVFGAVKERGGDVSKLEITNFTTLVQGPKYQNDFEKNREVYEQFQYIKVNAQ